MSTYAEAMSAVQRMNDYHPCERMVPPMPPVGPSWEEALYETLREIREWLDAPGHIDEALEAVVETLEEKHHDYGEENLLTFGELGILVRASDKVARLKNLIEKQALGKDETRADTWRDLAGYAIQGLIMMKLPSTTAPAHTFQKRRERLIRGQCPDCGEGVLIRRAQWRDDSGELFCSDCCGFSTFINFYELALDCGGHERAIDRIARQEAVEEQR